MGHGADKGLSGLGMPNEVSVWNVAQGKNLSTARGRSGGWAGWRCRTKLMYGMGPNERIWATARWQAGKELGGLGMPNEVSVRNGAQGENLDHGQGQAGGWAGWGCLTKLMCGMRPRERIWATARGEAGGWAGCGCLTKLVYGMTPRGRIWAMARGRAGGWAGWRCLTKLM